jgi:invasion protein IalB
MMFTKVIALTALSVVTLSALLVACASKNELQNTPRRGFYQINSIGFPVWCYTASNDEPVCMPPTRDLQIDVIKRACAVRE